MRKRYKYLTLGWRTCPILVPYLPSVLREANFENIFFQCFELNTENCCYEDCSNVAVNR